MGTDSSGRRLSKYVRRLGRASWQQLVEMSPVLMKRSKLMAATKRIVNYGNAGYYQVLSAEVGGKHGFSVSGLVFDEIHTQPEQIVIR